MAKSKTDFSEEEIREQISKASKKSEEYANDIDKFEDLVRDFENKLKKIFLCILFNCFAEPI